jgi:cell division protein FtsA
VELAEEIFHMPVRLARPHGVSGLTDIINNPIYSTAVGLLLYAAKQPKNKPAAIIEDKSHSGLFAQLSEWIKGNF